MGIKRDKYDATFSDLIRECADYTCQKCGRYGRDGAASMQCAHVFGRRNQSVRYDVDNAFCLCFTCHMEVDEDYTVQEALARKILGDARLEMLIQRKNAIKKWLKGEKDEMRAHYQEELKRVKFLRAQGEQGYIEPINYF